MLIIPTQTICYNIMLYKTSFEYKMTMYINYVLHVVDVQLVIIIVPLIPQYNQNQITLIQWPFSKKKKQNIKIYKNV